MYVAAWDTENPLVVMRRRLKATEDKLNALKHDVNRLIESLSGECNARIEAETEVERLREALKLYEEATLPGVYQFCGHHPYHDDLQPECGCHASTGCVRVASLLSSGCEFHTDRPLVPEEQK